MKAITPVLRPLLLAPAPGEGWRRVGASAGGVAPGNGATSLPPLPLEDAVGDATEWDVALPARLALFERLTLPATDPEELAGMARLQLEKTVPYPLEEMVTAFEILGTETVSGEDEEEGEHPVSHLMAWALHQPGIEALLEPLLSAGRYPGQVSLWGMRLAAATPVGESGGALWLEEGGVIFGVFERGRLVFLEHAATPEEALASLPQWRLSAELSGAREPWDWLRIDPELASWQAALGEAARVRTLLLEKSGNDGEASGVGVDLTPTDWIDLRRKRAKRREYLGRLRQVAAVYALLLVAFFLWNGWKRWELRRVEARLAAAQPEAEELLASQLRWRLLAPAIDPDRYTVEILYGIFRSLPSPDVRLTAFEQTPQSFMLTGEAPSAALAVEVVEKLKQEPALAHLELRADPPALLEGERAQFRIFGK